MVKSISLFKKFSKFIIFSNVFFMFSLNYYKFILTLWRIEKMLRQNMQISQNVAHVSTVSENTFHNFLKNNFVFPSNNLDEIECFIKEDPVLLKKFYSVPSIVLAEFPGSDISLDFMSHVYPDEKILEIFAMKSIFGFDETVIRYDNVVDALIMNFKGRKNPVYLRVDIHE